MCSPCAERQEGEGGALCSVLKVTEGRKQGLLWAEQRTAKEGHNGCSPYLQGPGRSYLLDLTPSQHVCIPPAWLMNSQREPGGRVRGERDAASGKGDSQPLGRNFPALVRQLTCLSTVSETQSEGG